MVLRVLQGISLIACILALNLAFATPVIALTENSKPGICDRAAAHASLQTGVPLKILLAITRAETGRTQNGSFAPWPWTTNVEGTGRWFEDRQKALSHTRLQLERGARNFDVGCFQINYRWHGKAFSSLEQMFEPLANAEYAAQFLLELYDELGDWSHAVAAYHSRTPKHATRYLARFKKLYARLSDVQTLEVSGPEAVHQARLEEAPPQPNTFPFLLQTLVPTASASLVPLESRPMTGRFIQAFVE